MTESFIKAGECEGGVTESNFESVDDIEVVSHLSYSENMLNVVVIIMFFLSLLINIDHGALPAALTDISKDLNLDSSVMGTMGSAVFFGLIIGSTVASWVF